MTISQTQRQQTEERIRASMDRLLTGQIPADGNCDVKTLAKEAGVSRAALYRSYSHLKQEFEQRLNRLRTEDINPIRELVRFFGSRIRSRSCGTA
jgi:hypothetical protein